MDLEALRTFVTVVEHDSFSQGAAALRIAKSTASQRVRALEASLGSRLLRRSTRKMGLTAAGEALYARGREIVAAAREAERALTRLSDEIAGSLRVSAPVAFGRRFLGGVVARMLSAHPQVELELDLSEHDVDLIAERFDLALRVGPLSDPGLIARRVGETSHLVVGSPDYLARRGAPATPSALSEHECLLFTHQRARDTWLFTGPEGPTRVRVSGRLRANHGDALADAAIAGVGLAWLPDFIVAPAIRRGALRVVLADRCRSPSPIHLVYPDRRLRPLAVTRFAEYAREELSRRLDALARECGDAS
ncbi:MAG: LysR family transcriptional regulator [Myxococcales bacterium]|nr:LysR family transcriptional regulator [Myxococcales bacterium]